jgi:hypothetical protein
MMKELGVEFSKAKTAVEIKYHPAGQDAAIAEFVGGPLPGAGKPSPPTGKSEIRMSKSETNGTNGDKNQEENGSTPEPSAVVPKRNENQMESGNELPHSKGAIADGEGSKVDEHAAKQPSPPAPLPEGEGGRRELLLIDSTYQSKTAHDYDPAWQARKPRKVPLGWRAAAIVVHPTNKLSAISSRQFRNVYDGQITDWWDLGKPERPLGVKNSDPGVEAIDEGLGNVDLALQYGTIHLYGPPAEDPISRFLENKFGRQHAKIVPRADVGKLIQTVARDPLAMGVVDLAEMPAGEASVKVLGLVSSFPAGRTYGAMVASRDKVPEDYWLGQTVDLWVSPEASQAAKDFADYLGSGECAAILARHGLVPKVAPLKKAEAAAPAAAGGKKGR